MRCWTCRRLLAPLREGTLRPRRVEAVMRHLARCEACAEQAGREAAVVAALEERPAEPLEPSLRDSLVRGMVQALKAPGPRPPRALPRLSLAWAPAAALVVIVLGVWGAWSFHVHRGGRGAAVVTLVVGEVEHQARGIGSWRPLRVGDRLEVGCRILTRAHGMLVFELRSGATVSVGPDSTLGVAGPAALSAERGSLVAQTRGRLSVRTPSGEIQTPSEKGQVGLVVSEIPEVAVSGYTAVWDDGETRRPIPESTSRPGLRLLSWVDELERHRVRQLLRETHPSLLAPSDARPGEAF